MMFLIGFITAFVVIAMWACIVRSGQISREEEKRDSERR